MRTQSSWALRTTGFPYSQLVKLTVAWSLQSNSPSVFLSFSPIQSSSVDAAEIGTNKYSVSYLSFIVVEVCSACYLCPLFCVSLVDIWRSLLLEEVEAYWARDMQHQQVVILTGVIDALKKKELCPNPNLFNIHCFVTKAASVFASWEKWKQKGLVS